MLNDEKEAQRKKRFLQREKYEAENCGQYELIYPIVSYQEEFDILGGVKVAPVSHQEEGKPIDFSKETKWEKQLRYLTYMEKAKQLWESFTNGNAGKRKKKFEEE